MPAHTTARILTVDDDPIVRADLQLVVDEHERRHYLTMIESMVRAGHSENEITRAVEASRTANT